MSIPKSYGIDRITVRDFKSLAGEHSIEIRPLTILAGANSSGKSSIMQPLLLMKQTLEASYDPGALLLDGPLVKFTNSEQFFTVRPSGKQHRKFAAGLSVVGHGSVESVFFKKSSERTLTVAETLFRNEQGAFRISPGLDDAVKARILETDWGDGSITDHANFIVERDYIFLKPSYILRIQNNETISSENVFFDTIPYFARITTMIRVPGLRGNPLRSYPLSATGREFRDKSWGLQFAGNFDSYTASIIQRWKKDSVAHIDRLTSDLQDLHLTSHVDAEMLDETRIELRVGRTSQTDVRSKKSDMVNIADVGFGVSQVLPVLVALEVAQPGQLVYLEQPEIHLHPRAQQAMALVLARAAMRGVRVVAETHSDLLILGIRTLVAEGKLPPELVKLHWFQRDAKGLTTIRSADVDERGASSDWPEDFADVMLDAQARYLDAAELRTESR